MITAVRRIQFCAGHRVLGHENKCATLHGHNYIVFFHAQSDALDSIGRVIDFSVLKEKLGGWVDKYWDHTTLISNLDEELYNSLKSTYGFKPIYICGFNPTAENMADYLLTIVGPEVLKDTGVQLVKVVLYETENCFVEAFL